uniref:uncharacterized protein LOC122600179 n=1 Tax=Erigeron canadensis TaxID=72917 RepID=UPI001CB9877F|nr:uncharacterized protein LOC122600179 [Erigeron canadensis]
MDDSDDCSSEMSGKQSPPLPTYAFGLYGEPENFSQVGDEYQIKIPPLITSSEYRDYVKNPFEEGIREAGVASDFLIGLDIPIAWITQEHAKDNVDSMPRNDTVPAPGNISEAWSEIERCSFVLGLFIFGKNFASLKRFMESKNRGDIMAYYYGIFYRGDEYKRWSECRKSRGKKCILGERIFSGLRLREFLARVFPHVSQECQNSLLEVCRRFGSKGITFEKYVIFLKTLVGTKMFIDAVAIGKGKQDLTGTAIEPTNENQAIHIRPEIPIGKACSSLTSREIIQFLTGDYRLSKGRSNDLFWEAVWPRLLARGWHSEQPNGYNYAVNGNHSLVFLMPGVKKFSRKLVKGDAYFDSVTDVLSKVASDPQLIELDDEENGENDIKLEGEENGIPGKRNSHYYLQPRAPNPNLGKVVVKFTVVDTSLRGGKIIRVRELESIKSTSRSHSDEIHSELASDDESDSANTYLVDHEKPFKKQKTSDERKIIEKKHQRTCNGSDSVSLEGPTMKSVKANLSRNMKQEDSWPQAKRLRRLSACNRVDSKAGSSLERDMGSSSHMGSSSQANIQNHKLSSNLSFTSRCSSIDTVEEQQMNLIDLNYPQVAPEFENDEFVMETKEERNGPGSQKQTESTADPKEQETGGSRRQSTRNRPPTAKALEALANGFLTISSRKKAKEDNPRDSVSKSRKSQRARGEVRIFSDYSTGDASSVVKGDDGNGDI